ncbi:hypothetical protein [Dongia sedimenti]|uniref:Lipoprotein n=1 Tax=Dongia sedimenti TaxID=3064282 RepID=A0ABU0YSY4_9PROT|nr:hypothetical protein [Rhodospirillaceae bacterium R-7]
MIQHIRPLVLLLGLAACSTSAPQAADLTPQGIGAVKLGMRLAEAEQALQARFRPMEPEESEACWQTQRADGNAPHIWYMVEDGKITRIDIGDSVGVSDANPAITVKTAEGIAIGAKESDVLAAYGPTTKVMPHKYDQAGHYLIVDSPDARSALVFETSNGIVTTFRAGFHPSVDYVEGCN